MNGRNAHFIAPKSTITLKKGPPKKSTCCVELQKPTLEQSAAANTTSDHLPTSSAPS